MNTHEANGTNEITMTEIVTRNESMLRGIVAAFMRKVSNNSRGGMIDREDMMQEALYAFIVEVRQYGETVAVTHRRSIWHALYEAARRALPVKVSYGAYRKDRRQAMFIEEWDSDNEEHQQAGRIDAAFGAMTVRMALEVMNEQEREIVRLRLKGLSQREIGLRIGLNDVQMCRAMKQIRRQFKREQ